MTPIRTADTIGVAAAVEALRRGDLVAIPTETVYGLAADARDDYAVAKIFAAKKRPRFNPLIVHVENLSVARELAVFNPAALVLPRREAAVSLLATAGLDTVAIRVPNHPVALALLSAFDGPLAAPSANPSGRVSPTRAEHAAEGLSGVAMVLDGGPCAVGLESTIVGFDDGQPFLLRAGGLARATIEAVAGPLSIRTTQGAPSAPGQLASHYAPRARLRLNALAPLPHEAFLTFGHTAPMTANPSLNLSPSGDLTEAAANLFAYLRALDSSRASVIAVMPIPVDGLGEAINDRLQRAAAPRDEVPE